MKLKLLAVVVFAALSGVASADDTGGKSNPDRIVCKMEKPIGSNIPKRTCMTAAERDRLREESQELMREVKRKTPAVGGAG